MLVLSRKLGEKLVISGGIVVTIVEVSGDRVRLGVDAPKDVRVDREEVSLKRDAGQRQSSLAENP